MKKPHSHKLGDVLFLNILPSEKSKAPICRTDQGLICLINLKGMKAWPQIGSTWMFCVRECQEKKLIIDPIEQTASKTENEHKLKLKLDELKKPKTKKEKIVYNYPYLRKN